MLGPVSSPFADKERGKRFRLIQFAAGGDPCLSESVTRRPKGTHPHQQGDKNTTQSGRMCLVHVFRFILIPLLNWTFPLGSSETGERQNILQHRCARPLGAPRRMTASRVSSRNFSMTILSYGCDSFTSCFLFRPSASSSSSSLSFRAGWRRQPSLKKRNAAL